MDLKELKNMEYLKCVNLLSKLVDLDDDTEERILKYLKIMGIKNFILHLETIDLPHETFKKLKNIKSVIEIFDEEGGQA